MHLRRLDISRAIIVALLAGSIVVNAGPAPTRASMTLSGKTSNAQSPTGTPPGSGFTYQGSLKNAGDPANDRFDFQFSLYDDPTRGALVADPIRLADQRVTDGLFTVFLDFGAGAFNGDARYLEISVRRPGEGYTLLSPRQEITPAPYALYALKTKGYKNVVTVAQDGGDFTTITAALNSITNNTATNKYLVWVAPGTYPESVTMKRWVDIEGAGELITKITFTGSPSNNTGTVVGAGSAELRSLTVENTGGGNTYAIAICDDAASPRLLHVTATASGSSNNYGVFNTNISTPLMTNVTATGSGGTSSRGIFNSSSSPAMTEIIATGSGASSDNSGVYNFNSSPQMNEVIATASSSASSENAGISNSNSSSPQMTNITATGSGGNNNYGVFNFSNSSPQMISVLATGSGGTSSRGVTNSNSSSPQMTNVTATAFGAALSYGVLNSFSSSPTIANGTISASGSSNSYGMRSDFSSSPTMNAGTVSATAGPPATNYGVYTDGASTKMANVTITASGGSINYGLTSGSSGIVTVNNSVIAASTDTLVTFSGGTLRVGASKLEGGPVSGPALCAGVYDENYAFFPSACP